MGIVFTPSFSGMEPGQLQEHLQDVTISNDFHENVNTFVNDIADHLAHNGNIPYETRVMMEQAKVIIYSLSESIEMLAADNG